MENTKNKPEQENYGLYDFGLKALVKSCKALFFAMVLIILGMLIWYVTLGGLCRVEPQEAAIVLRFGKYVTTYHEGMHWFLPTPISTFVKIKTSTQILNVDFDARAVGGGPDQPPPDNPLVPGADSYLLTGDANIIHSSWSVEYRIVNPKKYYETLLGPFNPKDADEEQIDPNAADPQNVKQGIRGPQTIIRNLLTNAVLKVTASKEITQLLSDNKPYADQVKKEFTDELLALDCGVEVTNVILRQALPPAPTRKAFSEVTEANQVRSTLIDRANEYSVSLKNTTQVKAQTILADADAYLTRVVAQVESESIYFKNIHDQYVANPGTVLMALYNSTLSQVLSSVKEKYIVGKGTGDKRQQVRLKLNPEPAKVKNDTTTASEGR